MTCPAVMGYVGLKQLLGFGWPQVWNLKKNGPLRKKILFLGHISSPHTQILPTSEQEFCSWENRSLSDGKAGGGREEQSKGEILFPVTDSSTDLKKKKKKIKIAVGQDTFLIRI